MYNNLYIVENTKNTFSEEFFSNTFITAIFDDVCNIVAFLADTGSQFCAPLTESEKQLHIIEVKIFSRYNRIVV